MTQLRKEINDALYAAVGHWIGRKLEPLVDRLLALERRQPERGEKGDPGERGATGEKGMDGAIGAKGDAGAQGEKGEAGESIRGEKGEAGQQGIPGERGAPGEPGEKGDPGSAGEKGDPGEKGEAGLTGERGEKGDSGVDGVRGVDGRNGRDGEPGRDAFELDVRDAIDMERAYPRGTWASHEGGLWVARTLTKGLEGWSCSVDGIAAITVRGLERGFEVEVRRSSGALQVTRCAVPAMIYRGIWQEQDYEQGDVVTRDGSLWHANAVPKGKPGDTPEWQLCVRRGRDGKDGLKGEKGERGGEGRAGRDLTQLGPDGSKW